MAADFVYCAASDVLWVVYAHNSPVSTWDC